MTSSETSIEAALTQAKAELVSSTPELDLQLMLCDVIGKERSFCFAYPETILTADQFDRFRALVARRKDGVPIAYLLHKKAFWSRDFIVTEDCLIPRPETELIIEWCLTHLPDDDCLNIADMGTGSGAIAVTLAVERPAWCIAATDISNKALFVAKQNTVRHDVVSSLAFYLGDWFDVFTDEQFDVIIANPPYVADYDPALKHEPDMAFYSENSGLKALQSIIEGATKHLKNNGYLLLEHGSEQKDQVVALLGKSAYIQIQAYDDLAKHNRMMVSQYERDCSRNK